MEFEYDSIAANVLNRNRVKLGAYDFKKEDDPLLIALKKVNALTRDEIEHIQSLRTSGGKMSLVIDRLRQRVTRELFLFFAECVGNIMKMPDLQRKILNELDC